MRLMRRACLWLLLLLQCCSFTLQDSGAADGDLLEQHIARRVEEKVLSRKRRYLTFPEGSSLQVVYDQTIPVVGLPLMYTIGVTVAIAYELPSKPWYQYAKDIRKNIQNNAYLLRKDQNVSQLTYTDQARPTTYQYPPANGPAKTNLLGVSPNFNYAPPVSPKHSYYYKDSAPVHPLSGDKPWNRLSAAPQQSPVYYSRPPPPPAGPVFNGGPRPGLPATKLQPVSNKLGYYFGQAPNQLATVGNQLSQWMKLLPLVKPGPRKPVYWSDVVKGLSQMASRRTEVSPVGPAGVNQPDSPIKYGWRKHHRKTVLPVFGKRSVDAHQGPEAAAGTVDEQWLDRLIDQEEEKHFRRHHRQTRHTLYAKIETYLNSKGLDGRACVLKTLCETGQQQQAAHLPNTFAAELIKTIFRLPRKVDGEELAQDIHVAYDRAHHEEANTAADCADLYPKCVGDLWSHPFLN